VTDPPALAALRERLAVLDGLHGALRLLSWDQSTFMPAGGAAARGEQAAAVERVAHEKLTDPEIARLAGELAPWADGQDPDGDEARLLATVRRDHEKAVRVPAALAADMARASALGQQAWLEAKEAGDFARFRGALERHVELAHRYAACFPEAAHPYDAMLDNYEPGLTVAELRPLLGNLAARLAPLVAATADGPDPGPLAEPVDVDVQRAALLAVLTQMGWDDANWRLDPSPHPFCSSPGIGDYRLTTRYSRQDFDFAFYSTLHEYGHGLYEAGIAPALAGTPLHSAVGLGVHESQSRLWENVVGRGRPFLRWLLPRLRELGIPLAAAGVETAYRDVNAVRPSLIRVDADETTYNLHIVVRFEVELALLEGKLAAAEVPGAFDAGMSRLLGVEPPGVAEGALQDIHWGLGALGYFPTYTLGNLMAAQIWESARAGLPGLDEDLEAGRFGSLREWLRETVHRHGRKFPPRELLRRVTGGELSSEPFLAYLEDKLADAGVMPAKA